MVWFKLSTNGTRARIVVANVRTLGEIKDRARTKFEIADNKDLHVFMEDGSEICCDEDLIPEVVEGKVLICCERFEDYVAENDLKDNGEKRSVKRSLDKSFSLDDDFTPGKLKIKEEEEPLTPDVDRSRKSMVPQLPKLSSPGAMSDSSVDSLCSMEGREPLELPCFTPTVKCALRDGDCNPTIWNMVLDQMQSFYTSNFPERMSCAADYRYVGEMMFSRYPCIRRPGKRPWSNLTHLLSGRIRTWRHTAKFKRSISNRVEVAKAVEEISSSGSSSTESSSGSDVEPLSQFQSDEKNDLVMMLDTEEYHEKMKLAKQEYEKKGRNKVHLKILLKETFRNRRAEVKRMDEEGMPMMSSVIIDWPWFVSGEYVMEEMKHLLGKTEKEFDRIKCDAKKVFEALEKVIPKNFLKKKGEERRVEMINFVADKVAFKKGRGSKSALPIAVYYGLSEQEIEEKCVTVANQAPILFLMFTESKSFDCAIVGGDCQTIDLECNDIVLSIMNFVACFFVFNVGFTREFGQFLGFFQQVLFKHPYTEGKKSAGFKDLAVEVEQQLVKMEEEKQFKKLCV